MQKRAPSGFGVEQAAHTIPDMGPTIAPGPGADRGWVEPQLRAGAARSCSARAPAAAARARPLSSLPLGVRLLAMCPHTGHFACWPGAGDRRTQPHLVHAKTAMCSPYDDELLASFPCPVQAKHHGVRVRAGWGTRARRD